MIPDGFDLVWLTSVPVLVLCCHLHHRLHLKQNSWVHYKDKNPRTNSCGISIVSQKTLCMILPFPSSDNKPKQNLAFRIKSLITINWTSEMLNG